MEKAKRTWVLMAICLLASCCGKDFKILFLAPMDPPPQTQGPFLFYEGGIYASAIQVALNNISQDGLLPGHTLSFTLQDTKCDELLTLRLLVEHLANYSSQVSAVIGPGCKCSTSARVAAAFNIPMISYMCTSPELSNKTRYPTFARTYVIHSQVASSVIALIKHFGWNRVGIVCEGGSRWSEDDFCGFLKEKMTGEGLNAELIQNNFPSYEQQERWKDTDEIYEDIRGKARIVILAMSFETARFFMLRASENEMTNGSYVYIFLDLDEWDSRIKTKDESQWLKSFFNATMHKQCEIRKAYESMLVLRVKSPNISAWIIEEIKRLNRHPPFNLYSRYKNVSEHPLFGLLLYDAVYQYAVALNKTLTNNEEPNGTAIINQLKGSRFQSIMGYSLTFNQNADLYFNLTLVDVDPKHGSCSDDDNGTAAAVHMVTVGNFYIFENKTGGVELSFERTQNQIHWGTKDNERPDDGYCIFAGNCSTPTRMRQASPEFTLKIVLGMVGFAVIFLLLFLGMIYRYYKMEKELKSQHWKIDEDQLIIKTNYSEDGEEENDNCDKGFTVAGEYRDTQVTIKFLVAHVRPTDPSRSVLMELKQMKDIRHDNLSQFIGAFIKPDAVGIVTEFSKRSLKEVLENKEQFKLDQMFIASLVSDIIKGMTFLHGSDIKYHGNLKSANCLVDKRLVLKITDYGLPTLRAQHKKTFQVPDGDMLHIAPEILNMTNASPEGLDKGDVYSFAIILQEFHTREGPYSANDITDPRDIVGRVKNTEFPPYRPIVPEPIPHLEKLRNIMTDSWEEDQDKRPTFHEIKERFYRLLTDIKMKPDLIDNVEYVLGVYADKLDDLVEQRTTELQKEKRLTDMLLYAIMPRSVAEQLKKNKAVEPKAYSEVSISFSDIVGFTSLSSDSTPMQVVDLLNDLYTLFDGIIEDYDVYKVETIGDAYMVVSGLPIRNGHKHAGEICRMALHLVEAVKTEFTVRHKPDHKLQLRVGIHSGPVVSGVVGNLRPRYCLFGDTVNMASRMESSGEALRIHISTQTKDFLQELGGYVIKKRGEMDIKGKGTVTTYWLTDTTDENPAHKRPPLHRRKPVSIEDVLKPLSAPTHGLTRSSSLRRSLKGGSSSPISARKFPKVPTCVVANHDEKQALLCMSTV